MDVMVRSYKSLEEEEEAILSAFRVFDKENTGNNMQRYLYLYMYMYIHTHIHTYMEGEEEAILSAFGIFDKENTGYICLYMYIYTYILCVYMYTYVIQH